MPLLLANKSCRAILTTLFNAPFKRNTLHWFTLTLNTHQLMKILPQFLFFFFLLYINIFFKQRNWKTKAKTLSFSHSLHKSFSGCFPKLFKIPNTRSSPAFLPIQFKLMEGHRYNLKYKMTNHVHEFQIHIYSCIWLWICVTDLKCSANKMKQHYGNLTNVKQSFSFFTLPLFFNFFNFFL